MVANVPRIPAAALTSGRARTSSATDAGSAVDPKPSEEMTYWPCTDASMAAAVEALTDWAVTAMNATRATPIITADAVDAVRLGLRRAFSLAMRPSTPSSLGRGEPSTAASSGLVTGPSTIMATTVRSAPIPRTRRLPPSGAWRPW